MQKLWCVGLVSNRIFEVRRNANWTFALLVKGGIHAGKVAGTIDPFHSPVFTNYWQAYAYQQRLLRQRKEVQ